MDMILCDQLASRDGVSNKKDMRLTVEDRLDNLQRLNGHATPKAWTIEVKSIFYLLKIDSYFAYQNCAPGGLTKKNQSILSIYFYLSQLVSNKCIYPLFHLFNFQFTIALKFPDFS